MFFADEFQVKSPDNILFNKNIYNILFNSNIYNNIPNILFYGLSGSGKNTIINFFIKKIFNLKTLQLYKSTYKISGYGNNTIDVEISHSNYHIIIEPNNTGFDKYLIQEIIKNYIKSKAIISNNNIPYKIIYIKNIDKLSYYAQTSLRCSMEKYSNYCKFFLSSSNISQIIEPIKSRCVLFKLEKPSDKVCLDFINNICKNKKIKINKTNKLTLLNKSDNNLNILLWNLDYYNLNNCLPECIILKTIIEIFDIFKNKIDNKHIKLFRDKLYNLFITNINFNKFIEILLNYLYEKIDDLNILYQVIYLIKQADLNISNGKRIIIHLENLIFNIIYLLKQNNINY